MTVIHKRLCPTEFTTRISAVARDIGRVEQMLRSRLGLPDESITKLTSARTADGRPVEPAEKLPTYENLVRAFKNVTKKAEAGDQIYIHYSGHGGRSATMFPELKGAGGLDESLVPCDIGENGACCLRDIELAYLLEAMSDKGLIVTLVLDSCHSGGATRGEFTFDRDAVPRCIPNFIDTTPPLTESAVADKDEIINALREMPSAATRSVSVSTGGWRLPTPKNFVLLAACRANELANEYSFDGSGERNGALTYWMLDALNQIGAGQSYTYRMLYNRVVAKVHAKFVNQTPQLEGERNREIFGGAQIQTRAAVNVVGVDAGGRRVRLNTGLARVSGEGGDARVSFALADVFKAAGVAVADAAAAAADDAVTRHFALAASVPNPERYFMARRLPPAFEMAKALGSALFASVFDGALRSAFEITRSQLRDRKTFLRLRLNLTEAPELATLPWEFLYNAEINHFFAQLPGTPVVRYLNLPASIEELTVEGPLRILVVISSPNGARHLDVKQEWRKMNDALAPFVAANLVILDRLDQATPQALQMKLQEKYQDAPYHIFHYIGHGVFDRSAGAGSLLFENERGEGRPLTGEQLGLILNGQGLRLAVINACEGAVSARTNSYAGVAQALCRSALIPAVLAMQFEITDLAAITFAEYFYLALSRDFPVEAALCEARKAVCLMPNDVMGDARALYARLRRKAENRREFAGHRKAVAACDRRAGAGAERCRRAASACASAATTAAIVRFGGTI